LRHEKKKKIIRQVTPMIGIMCVCVCVSGALVFCGNPLYRVM